MSETQCLSERDIRIARVLRSLGTAPMTRQQAERAGRLLGLHSSTVYKLRRRFLRHPVTSAVAPMSRGPKMGNKRLDPSSEQVIQEVLTEWLPRQRRLAHPLLDLTLEVRRRCLLAGLKPPGRNTMARRWAEYREAQAAALADDPSAAVAPGSFSAAAPLDIVQIDHTQADVIVVDDWFRRPLGRPWLSVAIDLATRCVMGIYLSMERPNAATVALLLSRVALPKAAWLDSIELEPQEQEVSWPMHGLPKAFAREALGSWLGRVAACYRMTVEQLILQHHLGIELQGSNVGWLPLPSQPRQVLHRLASLARLDIQLLEQLQIPAAWATRDCSVPYCRRCLVVNPLDVTAPYWQRCWLDPATRPCERHDEPMGRVPIAVLRRCRNFNDVLRSIQLQRRRDASRPPYA